MARNIGLYTVRYYLGSWLNSLMQFFAFGLKYFTIHCSLDQSVFEFSTSSQEFPLLAVYATLNNSTFRVHLICFGVSFLFFEKRIINSANEFDD